MLTSETTQSAVMFLISIGTVAANELKERWSLQREKLKLDLSEQNTDEAEVSEAVQEALSQKSDEDVEKMLDLVQRKRKLIYDAQREKLNSEEEYNEGRITRNMLELRLERSNAQIQQKLREIETDIRGLGLSVTKEAL